MLAPHQHHRWHCTWWDALQQTPTSNFHWTGRTLNLPKPPTAIAHTQWPSITRGSSRKRDACGTCTRTANIWRQRFIEQSDQKAFRAGCWNTIPNRSQPTLSLLHQLHRPRRELVVQHGNGKAPPAPRTDFLGRPPADPATKNARPLLQIPQSSRGTFGPCCTPAATLRGGRQTACCPLLPLAVKHRHAQFTASSKSNSAPPP